MKKIFILILSVISVLSVNAQHQQILNGNFEQWFPKTVNNQTIDTALNWENFVIADGGSFGDILIPTAVKTTDKSQGQYAAKMETTDNAGIVVPGLIQLGHLEISGTSSYTITGGQVFSDKPHGIRAFIKYFPSQGDTGFVYCYLTKWNSSTQTADTVAGTIYPLFDTIANYTEIRAPFMYKTADSTCDTINFMLTSSSILNPKIGSTLYADSVALDYGWVPYPTLALPATDTSSSTYFTANWVMSPYTNKYYIDVATDPSFNNCISGFKNKNITVMPAKDNYGNYILSYKVNFSTKSNFYYRIRVDYDSTISVNSNTIKVYSSPISSSIKEISEYKDYRIYNKILFLYNLPLNSRVQIFNLEGKNLFNILNKNQTINIPFTKQGVYILRVNSEDKMQTLKFKID